MDKCIIRLEDVRVCMMLDMYKSQMDSIIVSLILLLTFLIDRLSSR